VVPNGTFGSVPLSDGVPGEGAGPTWPGAALATGAKASAPPIAAAANHGAMCAIVLFIVFSPVWVADMPLAFIVAVPQAGVVSADTRSNLLLAGTPPSLGYAN
jgi:hypothetical protein